MIKLREDIRMIKLFILSFKLVALREIYHDPFYPETFPKKNSTNEIRFWHGKQGDNCVRHANLTENALYPKFLFQEYVPKPPYYTFEFSVNH